jgi:arylsulfatase A-like enzyme
MLVVGVKSDYYFVKYVWLLIPVAWLLGAGLARLRVRTPFVLLATRFVGFLFAATAFLVFTPMWQGQYLLKRANIYSEVAVGPESRLILVAVLVGSIIILFLATWIAGLLAKPARGRLLWIFLALVFIYPFIPPIFAGPPTVGTTRTQTELTGRPLNVVLVSFDTVRRDEVGCFGSVITKTPNIDLVAGQGTCFDNAITPMPLTGPAHMSMLTGLQPDSEIGHGVKSNGILLPENIPTLATVLDESGYRTAAIIGGWPLSRQASALQRGFHYYHDVFDKGIRARFLPDQFFSISVAKLVIKYFHLPELIPSGRVKYADEVTDEAIDWLDGNNQDPFFLFVHYYDAHYNYSPKPPYDTMYTGDYDGPFLGRSFDQAGITRVIPGMKPEDIEYYRNLYRGEVGFMDQEFGRFYRWCDERGLWDNTLLILVADHGESFEHGYYFAHTDRIFEPLVHVPLIICDPDVVAEGVYGNRVDTLVNVSDIYFTALDYLDVQPPESPGQIHAEVKGAIEGWDHNLVSLMTSSGMPGELNPESSVEDVGWAWIPVQSFDFAGPGEESLGRFFAYRFPDWKLMYAPDAEPHMPAYQYFDLVNDPGELHDILPELITGNNILSAVSQDLTEWAAKQAVSESGPTSFEAWQNLRSLGYIH